MPQNTYKKNKLIIDTKYLSELDKIKDSWQKKLEQDLTDIVNEGIVYLHKPKDLNLIPLYNDVRAYVGVKNVRGNYKIRLDNEYEVSKIRSVIGGHNTLEGSLEKGYSVKKVA